VLVYGDHREFADPAERLSGISDRLKVIARMAPGIARHAKIVGVLIEAGQVLQGAADEGTATEDISRLVHQLARCVLTSWDSGYTERGELPTVPQLSLPDRVELRVPEGFAFYAVYPEAYAEAARRLALAGPPRVIGIRSIGTSLGAIVSEALNAPPAITVRPSGDPFARKVELPSDAVEAGAHYIIVDEGPGMSGSSFGAVADWLEEHEVGRERIAFLPSHSGALGPQASEPHRQRWAEAQRVAAEFDQRFLEERFGPLQPFAGGGAWQRLKFLGASQGAPVLIKFAGLGAAGEHKFEMARALHAAGLTPAPLELVHGFLVERWYGDAKSIGRVDKPIDEVARYISARARLFPTSSDRGASVPELLIMCRRNIALGLGDEAADALNRFDEATLQQRVRRICTDNKFDREEWLRLPGGRLLKADALDHHQGHDLIGCQSLEWDVAGAIDEFGLEEAEAASLIGKVGTVDPDLLAFDRVAYAAFRLGQAVLTDDDWATERYRNSLEHLLLQKS
jgi:hypothetical protein